MAESDATMQGNAHGATIFDAYALLERGQWFAVVRCLRDGVPVCHEVILRDAPQQSAIDAIGLARAYAERMRGAPHAPDA